MVRSSFFEYSVATSALFSSRAKIQVNSHNIANADTKGYSRQYGVQEANRPMAGTGSRGMFGTGSSVTSVMQFRNFYVDVKYWQNSSVLGEYNTKNTQLTNMEAALTELNDTGIIADQNDFFNTLSNLSLEVGSLTDRNNVTKSIKALLENVSSMGNKLMKQQNDANEEVKSMVESINSLGSQVASLNKQIHLYEINGAHANDLRDKRALIVDQLSGLVNTEVIEDEETGGYSLLIDGNGFVSGQDVNKLYLEDRKYKLNEMDNIGLYDIAFATGVNFDIYSPSLEGELKGLIDLRDGNNGNNTMFYNEQTKTYEKHKTGNVPNGINPDYDNNYNPVTKTGDKMATTTRYKGLPHYMNRLNEYIQTLACSFNDGTDINGNKLDGVIGHTDAYDLNGVTDRVLFTYNKKGTVHTTDQNLTYNDWSLNYTEMTFLNVEINPDIENSPEAFAAADKAGEKDNSVAVAGFMKIKDIETLFDEGKLEDYVLSIGSDLGISVAQSENFIVTYSALDLSLQNERLSISGVSLDEEAVELSQNQLVFQAASQLIQTINTVYDSLLTIVG
ncbi:MAG: flagellar hook-associated protein FlgK [Lachnospirales bacterium]